MVLMYNFYALHVVTRDYIFLYLKFSVRRVEPFKKGAQYLSQLLWHVHPTQARFLNFQKLLGTMGSSRIFQHPDPAIAVARISMKYC
jgi:hypothetical protein